MLFVDFDVLVLFSHVDSIPAIPESLAPDQLVLSKCSPTSLMNDKLISTQWALVDHRTALWLA